MRKSPRCLYESDISTFVHQDKHLIYGLLSGQYHGNELTTTKEAWLMEIEIMQSVLLPLEGSDGHIIFEYDIPRLGKRIDVVLLLNGIVFVLNLKRVELEKKVF